MNVSLAFKQLTTKQYKFTAKERLMVIVAIGIIVLSIIVYMSTPEVAVEPPLPNDNVQKTLNGASKATVPLGKQVTQVNPIEQPIRDPFAKLPIVSNHKNGNELNSPVLSNNISNTLSGIKPSATPPNSVPSNTPQRDFKLTGIVSGGDRALAVIMSGSKSKAYAINDGIGSYKLTAINTHAVVLTNRDDKVVLYLESVGQKEGKTSEK